MTLKVLSAYQSSKPKDEIGDFVVPFKLDEFSRATHNAARRNVQVVKDYFTENGPNGTHLCIVSQFAGPSVFSLSSSPGMSGSRRLRGDLARKVAKQTATVLELIHSAGFLHGGSSDLYS